METSGPSFWLILLTIGVVLLGAAMAYGASRNRSRTQAEKNLTAAATRQEYVKEDREGR
ncbi:MAG TPA: hypothetical protein VIL88_06880 [Devosia sp.]|jgi:flagellar basal body-associated protein FliL|uniref:hypothetical protein n=1 Tax=Devosia sp. TaxID=1871048 RepID=UPI002F94BE96